MLRSVLIAILVSLAAVLVLARGARAVAPGHAQATPYDGDHEESHGAAASDNPYDEPSPQRHVFARLSLPVREGMLRLPGGRFTMGSSSLRSPTNERPARTLTLGPFWLDRTEVTVGAFRNCVDARVCARPARTSATCTYDADNGDLPVSCVHWDEAQAYCRFADKRLPTEAEWEYAARGPLRVSFPWGGGSAACANAVTLVYDQSGRSCAPRPARVGSHPGGASIFGVEDLSGNLEEWTADWYSESLGPGPGPRAGVAHVLRGGGWLSPPSLSRTTSRDWGSAMEAGPNVGFRCAKDVEPAP